MAFFCAAVLVPENPENVPSWREHYIAVRRRWYWGLALWGVAAGASASVNLAMPLSHPARLVHVTALAFGVVGALSSKLRLHAVMVATMGVFLIVGALDPSLDAAWLAQP